MLRYEVELGKRVSGMLLKVESLTRKFGGLLAVNDIDMEVAAGSIVGVVGPNGAGKTTLFNLISGQLKPTSGRILLDGKNVTGRKPFRLARLGVGRTFQTTSLFEELPVKINLAIAYKMRSSSVFVSSVLQNVAETLELIGLTPLAEQPAGSIPQIAKKRLAIGMAIIGQPRLLLLDEPPGGIGSGDISALIELIEEVRDRGVAICIIEHKMRMIMGLSDHMVVLNFGRKLAEGSPLEVSRNPEVIEAYLGSGYHA